MWSVLVDFHSESWTMLHSLDMSRLSKLNCFNWISSFPQSSLKSTFMHLSFVCKSYSPTALHYEVSGHETTIDMQEWL